MTYQHTAKSNVVPLLGLGPYSAIRLIELSKKSQTRLVAIVSNLLLHQILIQVKTFHTPVFILRSPFLPQFSQDRT